MSILPENYQPPDPNSLPTGPLDTVTSSYGFSHTMIRIKDLHVSLDFYTHIVGMTLVRIMSMPAGKFTNYFLCYPQSGVPVKDNHGELMNWLWQQQGILELCHNWGTELSDNGFEGYRSGNEPEHKGFGHICVLVDDLNKACDRFTTIRCSI
jgi:lactoylglutathione lyase